MKISSFICLNRPFVKAIGHAEIKKKIPRRFSSFAKVSLRKKFRFHLTCQLRVLTLVLLSASELNVLFPFPFFLMKCKHDSISAYFRDSCSFKLTM